MCLYNNHKQKNKNNLDKYKPKRSLKCNSTYTILLMKNTGTFYFMLFLILMSACATKKSSMAPMAVNTISKDTILPQSIQLKRGKICLAYTTSYKSDLPDMGIFQRKNSANFVSRSPDNSFWGGSSSLSKADSVVTNNYLVINTLYSAINKLMPGFEFILVNQEDFTDSSGKFDTSIIFTKYKPDILINISDLSFHVTGDPSTGSSIRTEGAGPGAYITGSATNYSGKIFILYDALWDVSIAGENTKKINMKGFTKSSYYNGYEIGVELLKCSRQAGADFAELLTEKKDK